MKMEQWELEANYERLERSKQYFIKQDNYGTFSELVEIIESILNNIKPKE